MAVVVAADATAACVDDVAVEVGSTARFPPKFETAVNIDSGTMIVIGIHPSSSSSGETER